MKKKAMLIFALVLSLVFTGCSAGNSGSASPQDGMASGADQPAVDYDDYDGYEMEAPAGAAEESERSTAGESYLVIDENAARSTERETTLTFSLKVDTAAYTNVARYLESGNLPPRDAVRTEELVNYFSYENDLEFIDGSPFAVATEIGPSPFDSDKYLAMVRVKTEEIDRSELPASNLTFLIDTSGSMNSYDKLPLLKSAFSLLVETLTEDDTVSIVTYAGSSEVVLDSASGADKDRILNAIQTLKAGGSTAGADGIRTAYALAAKNYTEGGNNRVILATDGDFNVGISNTNELATFIGEKRDTGVYLSVLGFGTGNIREDIMETLSKEGNGNYSYINTVATAQKVLVDEMGSNLFTVADDVKAQVEFNPQNVTSFRLIGYENRRLRNEDFDDDTVDAGEIGVGTDVVVLFELELTGGATGGTRYTATAVSQPNFADELFDVRIRYKDPGESESRLITRQVYLDQVSSSGSSDYRFATAVAAFGHLLRDSEYQGDVTLEDVKVLAENSLGEDEKGYRIEFLRMLDQYERLAS